MYTALMIVSAIIFGFILGSVISNGILLAIAAALGAYIIENIFDYFEPTYREYYKNIFSKLENDVSAESFCFLRLYQEFGAPRSFL